MASKMASALFTDPATYVIDREVQETRVEQMPALIQTTHAGLQSTSPSQHGSLAIHSSPLAVGVLQAGRAFLIVASLAETGAVFHYCGNVVDEVRQWQGVVKTRIASTIRYSFGDIVITMTTAYVLSRCINVSRLKTFKAFFVLGLVQQSVRPGLQSEDSKRRHFAWIASSALNGVCFTSLVLLPGAVLRRVLWHSFSIIGGLSLLGICTPLDQSEQSTKWLSLATSVVTLSRLGVAWRPRTVTSGALFYSVGFFGGLVVYGLHFIRATQAMVHVAKTNQQFDPIHWLRRLKGCVWNVLTTVCVLVISRDL